MVRPEGVEPPTTWFEAKHSIQLSYGRTWCNSSFEGVTEAIEIAHATPIFCGSVRD